MGRRIQERQGNDRYYAGRLFMAVLLLCPNLRCRKILSVPEGIRGKTVKCQHCQTIVRVPDKQQPPTQPAAAAAASNKK